MALYGNSVFLVNDDESDLDHNYEVWLGKVYSRLHPAPHAPIDQAGPEAGCTTGRARTPVRPGQVADARLKRHGPPSAAVVVAVTDDRLDFNTWERILGVSWMADRES